MVSTPTVTNPPRPRITAQSYQGYQAAGSLDDAARGAGLIQSGQAGDSVKQLQEQLRAAGYCVTADGKFGPETEAAVRAFQRDNGAKVDGLVGPETMAKLRGTTPLQPATGDCVDRGATPPPAGARNAPTEADKKNTPPGTLRAGDLARQDDAARAQRTTGNAPVTTPTGNTPVTLAPANATEQEKYDHYSQIIRANGGQVCPNGQATVLGIRGMSKDGQTHETSSARSYNDTFVVLTPDGHVRELSGATHPGQTRSTASPDVTGDGVGDVGMIKAGNYQVVPNGPHAGGASYHVRTLDGSGNLPGYRDTNQDGHFSDAERAASDRRGDTLNGVLFHQGGANTPISIGCQTLSPTDYATFTSAIGGPRAGFTYTLVDASR